MTKTSYWFGGVIVLLIASRFLHFGPLLDLPHDWRQADTAYYIQDFYENGIDLRYPQVCWMGADGTLALEFPLPEALVAGVQYVFGSSIPVSRLCFLLFFLLAAYYFYQLTHLLFGKTVGRWALLTYLVLPLGLFYSRAIHIDFFALAATHAAVYYAFRAIQQKRNTDLWWSSGWAILACLVKIPYLFFWALPVLAYSIQQGRWRWVLVRAWYYLLPLAAFYWWQTHAYAINSQAPDWDYIMHYRKFDQNAHWYFGSLAQRMSLYNWKVIGLRLMLEVTGGLGVLLALLGLSRWRRQANGQLLWWWIAGLSIYLLTFFNLNLFHNYYQLPFLALTATLIGLTLAHWSTRNHWLAPLGFGLLALSSIAIAEYQYYEVPNELDVIAQAVRTHTPDDALLILTYQDFDCRNPRLLYRADRRGWSLETDAAKVSVVARLQLEEGATHWAYVAESAPPPAFPNEEPKVIPLSGLSAKLYLYTLVTGDQ